MQMRAFMIPYKVQRIIFNQILSTLKKVYKYDLLKDVVVHIEILTLKSSIKMVIPLLRCTIFFFSNELFINYSYIEKQKLPVILNSYFFN